MFSVVVTFFILLNIIEYFLFQVRTSIGYSEFEKFGVSAKYIKLLELSVQKQCHSGTCTWFSEEYKFCSYMTLVYW